MKKPFGPREWGNHSQHGRICYWPSELALGPLNIVMNEPAFLPEPLNWAVSRPDALMLWYGHKNMMHCENNDDALRIKNWYRSQSPSLIQVVGTVTVMRFFPRLISAILLVSALLLPPVVAAWADSGSLSTVGGASVGQVDVTGCQDDTARHGEAEGSCCAPKQSCPPELCVSSCLAPVIIGPSTHEFPEQGTVALRIVKTEHPRSSAIKLSFPPPRT